VITRLKAPCEPDRTPIREASPETGSGGSSTASNAIIVVLALVSIVLWGAFAYQSAFLTEIPAFSQALLTTAHLPAARLDEVNRREAVFGLIVIYTAVAVAYLAATVLVLRVPKVSRTMVGVVIAAPVVYQIILGAGPGLLSADILSYAAYGHLAGLDGANPYVTAPASFPSDPFMAFVTGQWSFQPSVYGPLWNDISAALSRLFVGTGLVGELLAYRAFASILQLVNIGLFWLVLNRWPGTRELSLPSRLGRWALFSWNPNLLIEVGQSAHNDIVIVSSIIVSLLTLAPGRSQDAPKLGRWLAAVIALVIGALVKFVPVALVPLAGVAYWANTRSLRAWLRAGVLTALLAVGAFALLSIPWITGSDSLQPFQTAVQGGPVTTNDLAHEPAQWITARFLDIYSEHTQQSRDAAAAWISAGMRTGFVVYVLVEVAWLWRLRQTTRSALAALPGVGARFLSLLILLVLHQVRSWYFIWALPLAGVVQPRSVTAILVVLIGLCAFPGLLLVNESIWPGGFLLMLEIAVPASAALLVEASHRWRQWHVGMSQQRVPAVFESRL
jgi:hypothetical protein